MTAPPKDRDALVEVMARAICCRGECEVIGCKGRIYNREAFAAIAALEAAGVALVPMVATDAMAEMPGHIPPKRAEMRGLFYIMAKASPYAPEARSDD